MRRKVERRSRRTVPATIHLGFDLDVGDLERLLEARPPGRSARASSSSSAVGCLAPCPAAGRGSRRTRPSAPAVRFASAAGAPITRNATTAATSSASRIIVIGRAPDAARRSTACTAEARWSETGSGGRPVAGVVAVPTPSHPHLDADRHCPGRRATCTGAGTRSRAAGSSWCEERRRGLRGFACAYSPSPAARERLERAGLVRRCRVARSCRSAVFALARPASTSASVFVLPVSAPSESTTIEPELMWAALSIASACATAS